MLVVYALGRIFNTHKSVYILYQIKAEIIYFVSRGYNMLYQMKAEIIYFVSRGYKKNVSL